MEFASLVAKAIRVLKKGRTSMNGNPLSGRVFKDVQSHGISAFHEYPQEKYDETI